MVDKHENARFRIENGNPVFLTDADPAEVRAAIARSEGRLDVTEVRPPTERELRRLFGRLTSEHGPFTHRQRYRLRKNVQGER